MKKHREKVKNTGKTQGILSCWERGNPELVFWSIVMVSYFPFPEQSVHIDLDIYSTFSVMCGQLLEISPVSVTHSKHI